MQFAIDTSFPDETIARIAKELDGYLASGWVNEEISPAGVTSAHRTLVVGETNFRVARQAHTSWNQEALYINVIDPESRIESGDIESFRKAFKALGLSVKEVDYGLLADEA